VTRPGPPEAAVDGLFIIDKPRGCTSHDVVLRVRHLLGLRRVGHGGTLDPEAAGLLPVAVGRATRFFPYLAGQDKTYEGVIRLGYSTDTYDAAGRPDGPAATELPGPDRVLAAMKKLEGQILQTPPPYSAKKVHGQPGYRLARARKTFTLEPVRVVVRTFTMRSYAPPDLEFETKCSTGTYVRSLAHDLGQALGCGAHLKTLRRTSFGPFTIREAVPLSELEQAVAVGRTESLLLPLEALLPDVAALVVRPEALHRVRNGSPLLPDHLAAASAALLERTDQSLFRITDGAGNLLALARPSARRDRLLPVLVIR
jgi:tRNA pseudouridine55 synthase